MAGTAPPARTATSLSLSDLQPLAGREAMGDERRLERDDRPPGVRALPEPPLRGRASRPSNSYAAGPGIEPSRAMQRAAASRASSGPPTRKPAASASPAPVVSTTSPAAAAKDCAPLAGADDEPVRAALQHDHGRVGRRAERPLLLLVGEDDVRLELREPLAQRLGAERLDRGRRGQVDADARAHGARGSDGSCGRSVDRRAVEAVAGDVQRGTAPEPGDLDLLGAQRRRDPAVGDHGARPVRRDERDDDTVAAGGDGTYDLDSPPFELARDELSCGVGAPLAHEASRGSERRRPRRNVRGLAARTDRRAGGALVAGRGRSVVRLDDDVQEQVSERADEHAKMLSWSRTGALSDSGRSCSEGSSEPPR